jgi:hypothetical protein
MTRLEKRTSPHLFDHLAGSLVKLAPLDFRSQTSALVADTFRPGGCVQRVLHHLTKRQEVDLAWRRPSPRKPDSAAGLRFDKTQQLHSVVAQLDIGRDFWN